MLVLKEKGAAAYCDDVRDANEIQNMLLGAYNVKPAYLMLVEHMLKQFPKAILVETPIFVGSHKHIISFACESYNDLFHELIPYMDDFIILSDISISMVTTYGFCVNFYLPEHSHYFGVVNTLIRKSTIDDILKELC